MVASILILTMTGVIKAIPMTKTYNSKQQYSLPSFFLSMPCQLIVRSNQCLFVPYFHSHHHLHCYITCSSIVSPFLCAFIWNTILKSDILCGSSGWNTLWTEAACMRHLWHFVRHLLPHGRGLLQWRREWHWCEPLIVLIWHRPVHLFTKAIRISPEAATPLKPGFGSGSTAAMPGVGLKGVVTKHHWRDAPATFLAKKGRRRDIVAHRGFCHSGRKCQVGGPTWCFEKTSWTSREDFSYTLLACSDRLDLLSKVSRCNVFLGRQVSLKSLKSDDMVMHDMTWDGLRILYIYIYNIYMYIMIIVPVVLSWCLIATR